jgi:hypothetical protein
MEVSVTTIDNGCLKEARRRRITVTSSLNEISTNQLGNIVLMVTGGGRYSARPYPFKEPGIDSKESIPPAYVAWRAGTTTLFLLVYYPPWPL